MTADPVEPEPERAPLAIAFFDVEGYTAYTEEHGDDAGVALAHSLLEIAEELVAGARGTAVKRLGDGLLACFPTAAEAVRCALGVQRALQARAELADDAPVAAAKVGVHWGRPVWRDGDLYGNDVNVAARLVAQARGGQVLVSEPAREALGGQEATLEFKRIGKLAGKGLRQRPQVYRVQRRQGLPAGRPLALAEEGVLAAFLFDAPGDDMDSFVAGMRVAEAAFNGVGADVVFAGINIEDSEQPLMCVLIAFPDERAFETFASDPELEGLRSAARDVILERSMAAYHPLPELGALFPRRQG